MVAFTFRMPAGIAGDINRIAACIVEPQIMTPVGTTGAPTTYGVGLVVDSAVGNVGNMRTVAGTDTTIYGLYARPFPTGASQDALGVNTPPSGGAGDVLVRGYMTVLLQGATAATKGGQVYIWTGATGTAHPTLGGFEAASASGVITMSRFRFMGPADSNGFVEVSFNV
jgi:hypothetical protein